MSTPLVTELMPSYGHYGVNIAGGNVTATSVGGSGIYSPISVTIWGGQVCATGGCYGIESLGTITLGWTNATDHIKANSYYGNVTIADGKAYLLLPASQTARSLTMVFADEETGISAPDPDPASA